MNMPNAGSSAHKFEELAEQFAVAVSSYKIAQSKEQRRRLLTLIRVIIDKADNLEKTDSAELSE